MQIQDGVNVANLLSVAANITNGSKSDSKAESVEMPDFASFLNGTSSVSDSADNKNTDFLSSNNDINQKSDKDTVKNTDNKKQVDKTVDNSKTDNQSESKRINHAPDKDQTDNNISEEDIEEVSEAVAAVINLFTEKFNISVDEFIENMDQLNMDINDLLDGDSVKELFLDFQSADVSELLTDENLRNDLSDLINDFDQIIEDLPVSVEDAIKIIKENDISTDDFIVSEDDTDIDGVIENNISDNMQSGPQVEVNDETNKDSGVSEKSNEKKNIKLTEGNNNHFENPILQGIDNAINQVDDVSMVAPNTRPADIVEQIIEQVRVNINQDSTSMEMQLYPEHLGRIQINVISKDGVMTARIAAETETARQAIEAGLNNLKESLENQNLKVDAIEVMVSTAAFTNGEERQDSYQQQGAHNRNKRLNLSDLDDDISEEDQEIEKLRSVNGSSVTYLA